MNHLVHYSLDTWKSVNEPVSHKGRTLIPASHERKGQILPEKGSLSVSKKKKKKEKKDGSGGVSK